MKPIYGEIECQNEKCKNKAYWEYDNNYLCGVHSKKYKDRIPLKKDNKKKDELFTQKLLKEKEECERASKINKLKNKRGDIVCSKLRMMHNPDDIEEYIKVFPNFKHGNRRDGLGLPSLSPKSIGPVNHNQPGLPPAKNIENFHQGNKVFPIEVDENGEPTEIFFRTRLDMYNSDIPLRHKAVSNGKNVPLYSIWVDQEFEEHKISYFTSRQFYCHFYERDLLKKGTNSNNDYTYLMSLLDDGFNLQIIGYDGYNVNKDIEECYLDCSKPFGHELVLYTMLKYKEDLWPLRKYKTFNF